MRLVICVVVTLISFSGFSQKNDIFELFHNLPLNASHEEILDAAWTNQTFIPNFPVFKGSEKKRQGKLSSYKKNYFSGKIKEQNFNEVRCDSSDIIIATGERGYNGVRQPSILINVRYWLNQREEDAIKSYEFLYEYLSKFNNKPIFKEVDYGKGNSKGRMFIYKHFMRDGFYIIEVKLLYNDGMGHYISIMYWRPK